MKRYAVLCLVALSFSGCSLMNRDKQESIQNHRDESTETTKVTHKVGTEGGQPVDVTVTETESQKKVRDDTGEKKAHEELSSPALDHAAASLEKLAANLANAYMPGSGSIIGAATHALGLNPDTAAGLAGVAMTALGVGIHRRGKKKGHAEATKPKPLPTL